MIKNKILPVLSTVLLAATAGAQAQSSNITYTATNATNPAATNNLPDFLDQVAVWSTSFNTNYNWTNITVQIEDGYKQVAGSGATDYLRAQYNMGRWGFNVSGEFLGVGSPFTGVSGGADYALVQKYDFKLEAGLDAGYDRTHQAFAIEPGVRAVKLLTANTYAVLGLSVPWFAKGRFDGNPRFVIGAGLTF